MALPVLKALLDKRERALAGARFRAWWDGADFDEEAALKAIEANLANAPGDDADDALFDPPEFDMPARLAALTTIWGENRLRPGDDTADALEPARLGIADDGLLALLGPGLVGPVSAVAGAHPGKIEVFEWRDESLEALKHGGFGVRIADLFLGLTEPARSGKPNGLRTLLAEHGVAMLDHDTGVGGRYSVLTNVGLLAAALVGLDLTAIRAGAAEALAPILEGRAPAEVPGPAPLAIMKGCPVSSFPRAILRIKFPWTSRSQVSGLAEARGYPQLIGDPRALVSQGNPPTGHPGTRRRHRPPR